MGSNTLGVGSQSAGSIHTPSVTESSIRTPISGISHSVSGGKSLQGCEEDWEGEDMVSVRPEVQNPEFAEMGMVPVQISPHLVADPRGVPSTRVVVGGVYTCFPVSFEMAYGWDPEEPAFKWLPWGTEMAWWRNGRPIRRVSLQNEKPVSEMCRIWPNEFGTEMFPWGIPRDTSVTWYMTQVPGGAWEPQPLPLPYYYIRGGS